MAETGCLKDGHFNNLEVSAGGVSFTKVPTILFQTGIEVNDAKVTRTLDWQLGFLRQTTHSINLNDLANAAGKDNDIVGFKGGEGSAAEFAKIPDGERILSLTFTLIDASSEPQGASSGDMFSLVGHSGTLSESAELGAGGTELLSALECSKDATPGVLTGETADDTPFISALDYLFLANDTTNTTSDTPRTAGKITITFISVKSAGEAGNPLIAVGVS